MLLTPAAHAQTRLVEKVEAVPGQLVIPYSKYVLSNGLTVIVHEDRTDPLVHVDVTYHVGSAREEIGKSGFAHFFEHMMFQGSDNVGDEQHFKIVTEAGGTLNGSTNADRTNYYQTVPSNQLEKMLWLEADRMGFLLDAVTQRKFEIQRETVKNERGQNYDNVPYGLVSETIARALYPYGHPYSWPVIGYLEDLNRVGADDLKNFFLRWYGPNNAALTVGGDVDAAQVVALAEKYFGSIPRGPEVANAPAQVPVVARDRHVTLVDNYARQPRLVLSFPTIPLYHADEAPLDCLAEILGQGKNSVFYQQLVKNQKVLAASAAQGNTELSGEFRLTLTPAPGTTLVDTKKLLDEAMRAFEARGVTDDDIARFTGTIEASLISQLETVSGKVTRLAAFQTYSGNPNRIGTELRRYTGVTKADVLRVYERYIKGKGAVILSVATKAQPDNVVAPQDYTPDTSRYTAPDYGYAGLKYTKPKDTFDRTKLPGNGPNPVVKVPAFWREDLANGIKAIGTADHELPMVTLTLSLPGGHLAQGGDLTKAGLSRLVGLMLNEDTQDRTAEAFQMELLKLGSSINVGSDLDTLSFSVRSLRKNLDRTLALFEERLFRPKFTPEAFARIHQQTMEGFKSMKSQPATVATNVFAHLNYGSKNPLGVSETGTEETVRGLTLKDVEDYYARLITGRDATLVVVGDATEADIVARLDFLKKLPDRALPLPPPPAAPAIEKTRIYLVDIPRSAQTEFRVGYVTGLKYDATGEHYRGQLMNFNLGGNFNSRVNVNLREDKGWTYGARTALAGNKHTGTFAFSSSIRGDATDAALTEVLNDLGRFAREGITADELAFTQSALGQRDALLYESPVQKAAFLRRILDYNLAPTYVEEQSKILAAITKPELDALATKWVKTGGVNILLVGDKEKILPGLRKFDLEIVELDVNGEPVPKP